MLSVNAFLLIPRGMLLLTVARLIMAKAIIAISTHPEGDTHVAIGELEFLPI